MPASVHKLINVSENVGFHVVNRQFLYLFLQGCFNKNTVSRNNRFVPAERLSILAIQSFQAELAELLSPAAAVTHAWAVGNFPVKGEASFLEGPDHSVNEKATGLTPGAK